MDSLRLKLSTTAYKDISRIAREYGIPGNLKKNILIDAIIALRNGDLGKARQIVCREQTLRKQRRIAAANVRKESKRKKRVNNNASNNVSNLSIALFGYDNFFHADNNLLSLSDNSPDDDLNLPHSSNSISTGTYSFSESNSVNGFNISNTSLLTSSSVDFITDPQDARVRHASTCFNSTFNSYSDVLTNTSSNIYSSTESEFYFGISSNQVVMNCSPNRLPDVPQLSGTYVCGNFGQQRPHSHEAESGCSTHNESPRVDDEAGYVSYKNMSRETMNEITPAAYIDSDSVVQTPAYITHAESTRVTSANLMRIGHTNSVNMNCFGVPTDLMSSFYGNDSVEINVEEDNSGENQRYISESRNGGGYAEINPVDDNESVRDFSFIKSEIPD